MGAKSTVDKYQPIVKSGGMVAKTFEDPLMYLT